MLNTIRVNRAVPVLAAFVAAAMLAMPAMTFAGDRSGRGGDHNGNRDKSHNELLWKRHENGCAIGNDPPPGANCTNRDDDGEQ